MPDRKRWREIEQVYREGFPRFLRVARAITGERESAVDAVQEGFADALRHASQWNGRGSLDAWVWRCVVNRARKSRSRPAIAPAEPQTIEAATDIDLHVRLAALPERQRLVVFLRYFADLDYREIAETLDIRVGTVSATLHAAHTSLRTALTEVPA